MSELTKDILSCILNTNPDLRYSIPMIRKHPWFKQVTAVSSDGILVGYTSIPINKEILSKLANYNFDIEHSQKCIEANKHNHITTTYYLLLKKYQANEGEVQLPSEKTIFPRPPLLPFAPLLSLNIKPNLRHRKYIEKKVESTGGSSFVESDKKNFSPGRIITAKSNSRINGNSPNFKGLRSRRYISAGKYSAKEPTPRNCSRPTRIKTQKLRIKPSSTKKINNSFDYRLNTLNSSFKASPKFQDMSAFLSKIR